MQPPTYLLSSLPLLYPVKSCPLTLLMKWSTDISALGKRLPSHNTSALSLTMVVVFPDDEHATCLPNKQVVHFGGVEILLAAVCYMYG